MKRRVEEPLAQVKHEPGTVYRGGQPLSPRVLESVSGTVQFSLQPTFNSVMPGATATTTPGKGGSGCIQAAPVSSSTLQTHVLHMPSHQPSLRHKVHTSTANTPASVTGSPAVSSTTGQQQFQRLKVEDALSYLDQVKFKFGNQPQVYNDFLDIMKEFKSQSIDTPGVIHRVSTLFKGHPELIVGFNTFLPPGYKIEVQSNEQGYAFQVSVSMPSPTSTTTLVHTPGSVTHQTVIPTTSPVTITNTVTLSGPPPASGTKSPSLPTVHSTSVASTPAIVPPAPNHGSPLFASHPSPATTPNNVGNSHAHHNNSHHHALAQAHQAVSQALSSMESGVPHATPQSQPVEFNHAINYVNKIKNRFQGQPDKYKRFLEILHTYQKEQRTAKDGTPNPGKHLTEAEVYSQVAKLFEHQEDLLAEFGQFLPDATSHQSFLSGKGSSSDHAGLVKKPTSVKPGYNNLCSPLDPVVNVDRSLGSGNKFGHNGNQVKRSPSFSGTPVHGPPVKKHKVATLRDISLAEACKYGTLTEYAFFDKVRKAFRSNGAYQNFLRCLILYNNEIISKVELVQLVTPFLGRFPELFRWFKDFVRYNDTPSAGPPGVQKSPSPSAGLDVVPNLGRQDRPTGDLAMEIDYTLCKRLGASYCALPKSYVHPKCSGRTPLCKEVLNDTWVSFPTWSEDSTFVTSRKTQYEEYIYRCEDERFELDVVIETNASTIRVLEGVNKKLQRMSSEDAAKYRLDDNLGGSSPTIHQRALKRIYGDKAPDIIEGLKKNPVIAVPVVLRRLKAKEEEWREAKKGFNKIWREQNEKFYLKSLDHQGMNFKQNDIKALRSKSLFNEIESLFDERHEQADERSTDPSGPHLVLRYKDKSVLDDAANLLIHHVKRQTAIHKEDKQRIKQLLRHFVPDMFFHPRQELSEDEREDDDEKDEKDDVDMEGCTNSNSNLTVPVSCGLRGRKADPVKKEPDAGGGDMSDNVDIKPLPHALASNPDECYTLFFGNNHWYLFLRLHQILCERLTKMYDHAVALAAEEAKYQVDRKESTAVALRLKPTIVPGGIKVEDYYLTFLDMVKNVLDGNMENNTYEDTLREMFGIHAYIAFTLDKVVSYAVRQLQHLVCDELCQMCTDMFHQEQRHGGTGGPCGMAHLRAATELAYQRRAEHSLAEENCFKICLYKIDCKLTIELLDTEIDETSPPCEAGKWSYVDRFASNGVDGGGDTMTLSGDEVKEATDVFLNQFEPYMSNRRRGKPVFLPRNVRRWRRQILSKLDKSSKDQVASLKKRVKREKSSEEEGGEACASPKRKNSSSDEEKSPVTERPKQAYADGAPDEMQCRFNLNSYRMVYVVDKENFLYQRHALVKARESHAKVSLRLSTRFRKFHSLWESANVSESQQKTCLEWLMGRGDGVVPNRTRVLTDNDVMRAPYRSYNRYRVERLVTPPVES
ncbi:paired amphipathic helix protein Sin3b isoform X4 [Bacillus rossius redtenbacheri]|uniref:paired amphipathic helix protein Sin3b isoform X4 n=1 Tax=Bacillus rossius redtenbacheri TaxID=93214 RepID=UPI002FDE1212